MMLVKTTVQKVRDSLVATQWFTDGNRVTKKSVTIADPKKESVRDALARLEAEQE